MINYVFQAMKNKPKNKKQPQKPAPEQVQNNRFPELLLALIICGAFLVLAGFAFNLYFSSDDLVFIERTMDRSLVQAFSSAPPDRLFFRPLTADLYFRVLHSVFGLNPVPYHLLNFFIFAANIYLVFVMGAKISGQRIVGLWSALLYTVSFINFRLYTWLSCIQDLVMINLVLLSLFCFMKLDGRDSRAPNNPKSKTAAGSQKPPDARGPANFYPLFFALGPFCYFLSLFAKESAVWFPVWLWLFELLKGWSKKQNIWSLIKSRFLPHLPFDLIMLVFLPARMLLLPLPNEGKYQIAWFGSHLFRQLDNYLGIIAWGSGLPIFQVPGFGFLYIILSVIILTALFTWLVRKRMILVPALAGLAWSALGISIFTFMANQFPYEYYISLASIGFFWAAGYFLNALFSRVRKDWAGIVMMPLLLLLLVSSGSKYHNLYKTNFLIKSAQTNRTIHERLKQNHPDFPPGSELIFVTPYYEKDPLLIGARALYNRKDLKIFVNDQAVSVKPTGDGLVISKIPGFDYRNSYIFVADEGLFQEIRPDPDPGQKIIKEIKFH